MNAMLSTKLHIPHPTEQNCAIVGILQHSSAITSTNGRKIALILHGAMGHKDYLFQKRLAQRLPIDSFRFDFRGNHETPGTWKEGGFADDLIDLSVVVEYLKATYGYVIDLIIGHSRGSLVAMRWICTTEDGKKISAFVNVSSRYRMSGILKSPTSKDWQSSFDQQGYHDWTVTVARIRVTVKIFPEDVERYKKWDTSIVWDQFPPHIDALTVHGLVDQEVPPYDAVIYAQALGNRSPGTHTLHFVEDADHNFTGRQEEVIETILKWRTAHQRKELVTGFWSEHIRNKL